MAVIQYFLPGANAAAVASEDGKVRQHELDAFGLLPALSDLALIPRDATLSGLRDGPGGSAGLLVTPRTRTGGQDTCYHGESQEWREAANGRYWLGTSRTEPVRPDDLVRRLTFLGYNVGTEGGDTWLIPVARSEDDSRVTLPQDVYFENGRPHTRLRAQYRALWDLATHIVSWCSEEPDSPAAAQTWRIDASLRALAVNYRVWQDEISLTSDIGCPILSTDMLSGICLSLADIQFANVFKKKDELESGRELLDSEDFSPGTEDESSIAQVGAS